MDLKKYVRQTSPFRSLKGEVVKGSIAENGHLRLGGIEQYVLIRGENVSNPVLVILHGGPGFSDTAFFRYSNSLLEKHFTIVYWDQRGTGKSYNPNIPKSSMVVEQFISDLKDLINFVCTRFKKEKVTLLGHSWGSVLGVMFTRRFPSKIAAYIGCAQYGNWLDSERSSFNFAIAEARRQNKPNIIRQLMAIGPPPYSARNLLKERALVQRLNGDLKPKALGKMARMILSGTENGFLDLISIIQGFQFSIHAMWNEVLKIDLISSVPSLEVPVYFLLGRHDHWVPPETSLKYFESLDAPSKQIFWFENSGHEPFVDEPEEFNRIMSTVIHPTVANLC